MTLRMADERIVNEFYESIGEKQNSSIVSGFGPIFLPNSEFRVPNSWNRSIQNFPTFFFLFIPFYPIDPTFLSTLLRCSFFYDYSILFFCFFLLLPNLFLSFGGPPVNSRLQRNAPIYSSKNEGGILLVRCLLFTLYGINIY